MIGVINSKLGVQTIEPGVERTQMLILCTTQVLPDIKKSKFVVNNIKKVPNINDEFL